MLLDSLNRPLHDLRISVTDRCNFRCNYCMPKEVFGRGYSFLGRDELLSFEEIEKIARAFVGQGVQKIRLTGGEPLIRSDLETLVQMLSAIPDLKDLSLTTNASLLTRERARSLRSAGVQRLNISLDALDDPTFTQLNSVNFPVEKVLTGIDHAVAAGFKNIKINMVVQKGINDHGILPMAAHFLGSGVVLRFIEYMDVGNANAWQLDEVTTAQEILDTLQSQYVVSPVDPNYTGEVAKRWHLKSVQHEALEVGIISSVSEPFCHDCSRARLSAIGEVYNCLFASKGHDLRKVLREQTNEAVLTKAIQAIWSARQDRYSQERSGQQPSSQKVEMSYIGG